ncbi:MAG: LamG-like jellyroll fold domain-containing protein, partial [Bryobacteraceae bacterium]
MRSPIIMVLLAAPSLAVGPDGAVLYFDFSAGVENLARRDDILRLNGARHTNLKHDPMQLPGSKALEFRNAFDVAETDMARLLDKVQAASAGGWFYTRRKGEQVLLSRGLPEIDPLGNRLFRPETDWVNFVLGTDQRGFVYGTINGNGEMPFAHVTVDELPINTWNQLVVVKTAKGYQEFYRNGTLVHTDRESTWQPKVHVFHDTSPGATVRLSVQQGGLIGEAWVYPRALTAD